MTTSADHLPRRLRRLVGGIRFRLTLWYALVLGGVLLLVGLLLFALESQMREYTLDNRLTNQSHALREDYNVQTGLITPHERANSELAVSADEFMLVYNAQGALVQHSGPLESADITWFTDNQELLVRGTSAETFLIYTPGGGLGDAAGSVSGSTLSESIGYRVYISNFLEGNTKIATLILGRPRADQSDLIRLATDYMLLGPLMIAITASGAYWLAGRAMKPVRMITRTARTIGETDLSRRLNLPGQDEIAELAGTFDQMLGRLDAAFERQRRFTRDASHELRTPLTIVELEVGRALARPRTVEEYVRALMTIQTEATYMAQLVNNLLILARADSGRVELARTPLDLSDIMLDVAERLTLVARQNSIDLRINALPELPICGDRLYLTQMLVNLIENAVKYTAGIGQQVTVETGCDPGAKTAWARIGDDGPGISAEHLPHLFERFYRVDQARTANSVGMAGDDPGSGLGLSIVQWVAQVHGGSVKVKSEVGKGSIFEVRLPLFVMSPS